MLSSLCQLTKYFCHFFFFLAVNYLSLWKWFNETTYFNFSQLNECIRAFLFLKHRSWLNGDANFCHCTSFSCLSAVFITDVVLKKWFPTFQLTTFRLLELASSPKKIFYFRQMCVCAFCWTKLMGTFVYFWCFSCMPTSFFSELNECKNDS